MLQASLGVRHSKQRALGLQMDQFSLLILAGAAVHCNFQARRQRPRPHVQQHAQGGQLCRQTCMQQQSLRL